MGSTRYRGRFGTPLSLFYFSLSSYLLILYWSSLTRHWEHSRNSGWLAMTLLPGSLRLLLPRIRQACFPNDDPPRRLWEASCAPYAWKVRQPPTSADRGWRKSGPLRIGLGKHELTKLQNHWVYQAAWGGGMDDIRADVWWVQEEQPADGRGVDASGSGSGKCILKGWLQGRWSGMDTCLVYIYLSVNISTWRVQNWWMRT